jgi:hypothetical protein
MAWREKQPWWLWLVVAAATAATAASNLLPWNSNGWFVRAGSLVCLLVLVPLELRLALRSYRQRATAT